MKQTTDINVNLWGRTIPAATLRKAQMILALARRIRCDRGDDIFDAWFCAGCPVGRSYHVWSARKSRDCRA